MTALLLDAVPLQALDHGVGGERDGDVEARHRPHAALEIVAPLLIAAPDRQRRYPEDEGVGFAVHHPGDGVLERLVNALEHDVEVVVAADRGLGDHHACEVVGDAGRAHVVVLGLHHRVGRGGGDAEGQAPGQIVAHGYFLPGRSSSCGSYVAG